MKKSLTLLLFGAISTISLTSCNNAGETVANSQIETKQYFQGKFSKSDTIKLTESEADHIYTDSQNRILCSVGVGHISGHTCFEVYGVVYNHSWHAIPTQGPGGLDPVYQINPDTGGYFYNHTLFQQSNCNCR